MSFGSKHELSAIKNSTPGGKMPADLFRDSFVHGMSMFLGGVFGICVWVSAQPEPIIKPYLFELSLVETVVAPNPVAVKTIVPDIATKPADVPMVKADDLHATPAPDHATSDKMVQSPDAPRPSPKLMGPRDVAVEPLPGPVAAMHESATPVNPVSAPSASPVTPQTLVPFPVPGMTEDKPPYGALPVMRAGDQARPFDVYRVPFAKENLDKPLISVVVMDFGLSQTATSTVLQSMPVGTAVVLNRTARGAQDVAAQAHKAGFEIWADLAVEPMNYPADDPGANALFSNASIEQNQDALYRQLAAFMGYAGVFVSSSSPYLKNNQDADFLSRALFSRGLGVMANTDQVDNAFVKNAASSRAPFFAGAMIRVDEPSDAVRQMKVAQAQALKNGYSILVIPPSKGVGLMVQGWIKGLADQGIAMAPLSVIAERGLILMAGRTGL